MRIYSNTAVETRLTAAIDAASVSVSVGDVTGWPVPAGDEAVVALSYGSTVEIATYTGIDGTTLTGLSRGLDGTIARAHTSGAAVAHVASAADVQTGAASQEYTDAETAARIAADDTLAAALVERLTEAQADALYRQLGVLITEADVDFEVGGGSGVPPLASAANVYIRPSVTATAAVAFSAADFRMWLVPLPPGTIRSVALEIPNAGDIASRLRPVFYLPDGPNFFPNTLLLDGGQLDTSTTGFKSFAVPNTPWAGGSVWVGVHHDAGTAPFVRYATSSAQAQVVPASEISLTSNARIAVRSLVFPQGPAPAVFPPGAALSNNPTIVGVECY